MVKSPVPDREDSSPELSELVAYEELSYEDDPVAESRRMKHMHHYVPVNPFRATVRLHRRPRARKHPSSANVQTSSSSGLYAAAKGHSSGELFFQSLLKYPYVLQNSSSHTSATTNSSHVDTSLPATTAALVCSEEEESEYFYGDDGASLDNEDFASTQNDVVVGSDHRNNNNKNNSGSYQNHCSNAASPTSFPSTPFSRAFVMNRSAERVDSVMFAARDWLRLQTQTNSRDAHTR